MEDRYAVVRVDLAGYSNGVVGHAFSADEAVARAREYHANTGVECYAARLVPVALDKKSSLVILREQTAAIASLATSTQTRTEQIYFELQQLRTALTDAMSLIQEEVSA